MRPASNALPLIASLSFAAALVACNALSGADDFTVSGERVLASDATGRRERDAGDTTMPPGTPGSSGSVPPPVTTTQSADAGVDDASTVTPSLPTFVDDFARGDGTIGNGWLEKSGGKFAISNGAVQQLATGSFQNLIVHRPSSENALDVEVAADVTYRDGDPGLLARLQPTGGNSLVAYTMFADGAGFAVLMREQGTSFKKLGEVALAPSLVVGQTYRFTLRVTGTSPVRIEASIVDGSATLGSLAANDMDGDRIAIAGAVGFGSGSGMNVRYDNFKRVTLTP